jgi:hypothetical protein
MPSEILHFQKSISSVVFTCLLLACTQAATQDPVSPFLEAAEHWEQAEVLPGFITTLEQVSIPQPNGQGEFRWMPTQAPLAFAWSDQSIAIHIPFKLEAPGWVRVIVCLQFEGLQKEDHMETFNILKPNTAVTFNRISLDAVGLMPLNGKPVADLETDQEGIFLGIENSSRFDPARPYPYQRMVNAGGDFPRLAPIKSTMVQMVYPVHSEVGAFQVTDDRGVWEQPLSLVFSPAMPRGWYSLWGVITPQNVWSSSGFLINEQTLKERIEQQRRRENRQPAGPIPNSDGPRPVPDMPDKLEGKIIAKLFEVQGTAGVFAKSVHAAMGYEITGSQPDLTAFRRLKNVEVPLSYHRNGWVLEELRAKLDYRKDILIGPAPKVVSSNRARTPDETVGRTAFEHTETTSQASPTRGSVVLSENQATFDFLTQGPVFRARNAQYRIQRQYTITFPQRIMDQSVADIAISGQSSYSRTDGQTEGWNPRWTLDGTSSLELTQKGLFHPDLDAEQRARSLERLTASSLELNPMLSRPMSQETYIQRHRTDPQCVLDAWLVQQVPDSGKAGPRQAVERLRIGTDVGKDFYAPPERRTLGMGANGDGYVVAVYRRLSDTIANNQGTWIPGAATASSSESEAYDGFYEWCKNDFFKDSNSLMVQRDALKGWSAFVGLDTADMLRHHDILVGALRTAEESRHLSYSTARDWVLNYGQQVNLTEEAVARLRFDIRDLDTKIADERDKVAREVDAYLAEVDRALALITAQETRTREARQTRPELKRWRDYWEHDKAVVPALAFLTAGDLDRWEVHRHALSADMLTAETRFVLAEAYIDHGRSVAGYLELRRLLRIDPDGPQADRAKALCAILEKKFLGQISGKIAGELQKARTQFAEYMASRGYGETPSDSMWERSFENFWQTVTTGPAASLRALLGGVEADAHLSLGKQESGTLIYIGLQAIKAMLSRGIPLNDIEGALGSRTWQAVLPMRKASGQWYDQADYAGLGAAVHMAMRLPEIQALLQEDLTSYKAELGEESLDVSTGLDTYLEASNARMEIVFDALSVKNTTMILLPFSVGTIGGKLAPGGYWGFTSAEALAPATALGIEIRTGQEVMATWLGWERVIAMVNASRMGPRLNALLQKSYNFRNTGGTLWKASWTGARITAEFFILYEMVNLAENAGGPKVAAAVDAILSTFAYDPELCWNLLQRANVPPQKVSSLVRRFTEESDRMFLRVEGTAAMVREIEKDLVYNPALRPITTAGDIEGKIQRLLSQEPLFNRFIPGRDMLVNDEFALYKAIKAMHSGHPTEARKAAHVAAELLTQAKEQAGEVRGRAERLKTYYTQLKAMGEQSPPIAGSLEAIRIVDLGLRPASRSGLKNSALELYEQGDWLRFQGDFDGALKCYEASILRWDALTEGLPIPKEIAQGLSDKILFTKKILDAQNFTSAPDLAAIAAKNRAITRAEAQALADGIASGRVPMEKIKIDSLNEVYRCTDGAQEFAVKYVVKRSGQSDYDFIKGIEAEMSVSSLQGLFGITGQKPSIRKVTRTPAGTTGDVFEITTRWLDGPMLADLDSAQILVLKEQIADHKIFSLLLGDYDRHIKNYKVIDGQLVYLDAGVGNLRGPTDALVDARTLRAQESQYLEGYYDRHWFGGREFGGPIDHWWTRAKEFCDQIKSGRIPTNTEEFTKNAWLIKQKYLEECLTYQDCMSAIDRAEKIFAEPSTADELLRRLNDIMLKVHGDPAIARRAATQAFDTMKTRAGLLRDKLKRLNTRNNVPLPDMANHLSRLTAPVWALPLHHRNKTLAA